MAYCTVQDFRDEGVTDPPVPDAVLTRRIALATALIDRWTGRWFEPRVRTLLVDGSGGPSLLLGPPIISVSSVRLIFRNIDPEDELVDLAELKIYNRHLSGFLDEDDRENPRIDWLGWDLREVNGSIVDWHRAGMFGRGTQNVQVVGSFGYTDPDVGGVAAATGVTPPLIKHACMLLVMRNLALLGDVEAREEMTRAARVTELRTRDQAISYAGPGSSGGSTRLLGAFSGDPEIDNIIASYCRPPRLGAA